MRSAFLFFAGLFAFIALPANAQFVVSFEPYSLPDVEHLHVKAAFSYRDYWLIIAEEQAQNTSGPQLVLIDRLQHKKWQYVMDHENDTLKAIMQSGQLAVYHNDHFAVLKAVETWGTASTSAVVYLQLSQVVEAIMKGEAVNFTLYKNELPQLAQTNLLFARNDSLWLGTKGSSITELVRFSRGGKKAFVLQDIKKPRSGTTRVALDYIPLLSKYDALSFGLFTAPSEKPTVSSEMYAVGYTSALSEYNFSIPVYETAKKQNACYVFGGNNLGNCRYLIESETKETVLECYMEGTTAVTGRAFFLPDLSLGYFQGRVLNSTYVEGRSCVGYLLLAENNAGAEVENHLYRVFFSTLPALTFTEQSTSGVGLSAFVNKAAGQVFLQVDLTGQTSFELEIIDFHGNAVQHWTGTGSKTVVWFPGEIKEGNYLVVLQTSKGKTSRVVAW
ncbi:hypothetical protein GC194_06475 [bacterium]|nr:hypothetical protein [bacterium]